MVYHVCLTGVISYRSNAEVFRVSRVNGRNDACGCGVCFKVLPCLVAATFTRDAL